MFSKNSNITIKRKIYGERNLYSRSMDCGFKKFKTIDKEQLSYIL